MADVPEQWSWRKFILGFFDGRNYAKSIIFLVCSAVILTISFSVYTVVKNKFAKPAPIQTQSIGTNQGTVNTTTVTRDNRESKGFTLLNAFDGWFSKK